MRDALLRSEGARRIVNSDIIESEDGSGVLKIHDDHWQDAYLSADTMIALSTHNSADSRATRESSLCQ